MNETDDSDDDTGFSRLKSVIENDDIINLQISISKTDILLACLRYCRVYSTCQSGMVDLFKMINSILQTKILPETRYLADQLFNSKKGIEHHSICPKCKRYVSKFDEKFFVFSHVLFVLSIFSSFEGLQEYTREYMRVHESTRSILRVFFVLIEVLTPSL